MSLQHHSPPHLDPAQKSSGTQHQPWAAFNRHKVSMIHMVSLSGLHASLTAGTWSMAAPGQPLQRSSSSTGAGEGARGTESWCFHPAPSEGISSALGGRKAVFQLPEGPEFVFQEEAAAQRRGWSENLQFYTGIGYLGGKWLVQTRYMPRAQAQDQLGPSWNGDACMFDSFQFMSSAGLACWWMVRAHAAFVSSPKPPSQQLACTGTAWAECSASF